MLAGCWLAGKLEQVLVSRKPVSNAVAYEFDVQSAANSPEVFEPKVPGHAHAISDLQTTGGPKLRSSGNLWEE